MALDNGTRSDPRRYTAGIFVEKARTKHGDRYNYELVEYTNSSTSVKIMCPTHGVFEQKPASHLQGSGCAACSGRKRHTNASFIAAAREVHGDRYTYDLVEYAGNKAKVELVCPEHGVFKQSPNAHLRGNGCAECAHRKALNTDVFIARARQMHGDKYDYGQVNYSNIDARVTIVCPEHGTFEQVAYRHLSGYGCGGCSGRGPLDTATFIERAREVHGNRYGYAEVQYRNAGIAVRITCPDHRVFEQLPTTHLRGSGCPRCSGMERHTNDTFIARAREAHGFKYGYELVEYVRNKSKVRITCPEHGVFEQTPNNHMNGSGCPDCAGRRPLTTDVFIARSSRVHGGRYGYDQVEYLNNRTNVTILCRDHGPFEQTPDMHMSGQGCAACAGNSPGTTETFIERSRAIHGSRYGYELVEYVSNKTKVRIACPEHGVFEQYPQNHQRGEGCRECAGLAPLTNDIFEERARALHGDRYDYRLVDYRNINSKVALICSEHGVFEQLASSHLSGHGCWQCSGRGPLNSATFIQRAQETHGSRYGYDLVEYVNIETNVRLVCNEHEVFEQTPHSHLGGAGCPQCAGNYPLDTAAFIRLARGIHGEKYNYGLVDYDHSHAKVRITCPEHGVFLQKPNGHLSGNGCPLCGGPAPVDTATFIERALAVHGDKYDYSVTDYVTSSQKVQIKCPQHGVFEQSPAGHMTGKGCHDCSGRKRLNTDIFLQRSRQLHGSKFDYSFVKYVNSTAKVAIICPEHGAFSQSPSSHMGGAGCPLCSETLPESIIRTLFEAAGVQAIRQWKHESLRHRGVLSFDFMLPAERTLVEYDGPFHHAPQYWRFKTREQAEAIHEGQQYRDKLKDEWAAANGWRLVRLLNPDAIQADLIAAGLLGR